LSGPSDSSTRAPSAGLERGDGDAPPVPVSGGILNWRGAPLSDLTYTVLDLETTGLKAEASGITEVCCLRVSGGQIVDSFESLVNPRGPIPYFIQRMTGITDEMVRDAPDFGQIAPRLLAFVAGTVLVAHNAPFDMSFLNHHLPSNGHCILHNPVIDTRRLARKLLPDLQRTNLDAVTAHLGVAVQGRHRARGDAEATAQALLRLLSICLERGIETDAHLDSFLSGRREPEKPAKTGPRGRRAAALAILAERCRSLPDAPGVYLMRSASGRVLYVGKAVSLRRRVLSYFNGGVTGKARRMMSQVESVEQLQLGSELEALLEESRLIKLHQPPFNTLLRSYRNYPFIKVEETGPYPRLVLTREVLDDGARYFGPFRKMRETETALEVLARCFRLYDGRCPVRCSGESCLYYQMNRCLAPCLGGVHAARHAQALEEVCRLLESEPDDLVAELVRRRSDAAERLDFEAAARYRDGIDALSYAFEIRKLLAPEIQQLNLLAVCPSVHHGCVEMFLFGAGRLIGRTRVQVTEDGSERAVVEGLLREIAAGAFGRAGGARLQIDAESLDQVNIISNWLSGRGSPAGTLMLEPGWAAGRFSQVVEWAVETARGASHLAPRLR
jgi:DNA polymerase III subunit epsilon